MSGLVVSRNNLTTIINEMKAVESNIKVLEAYLKDAKALVLEFMKKENLARFNDGQIEIRYVEKYMSVFDKDGAIEKAIIEGRDSSFRKEVYDDDILKAAYPEMISRVKQCEYIKLKEKKHDN